MLAKYFVLSLFVCPHATLHSFVLVVSLTNVIVISQIHKVTSNHVWLKGVCGTWFAELRLIEP